MDSQGVGLSIGAHVQARWQGGNFYAGKITANDNDVFTIIFDDGDIDEAVPRANIRSTASSDNAASCAESLDPSPPGALPRTKASPRKAHYMNMNTQKENRALKGNEGALHRAVGDEAAQGDLSNSIGGLNVGDMAMIRRSDGTWRYAKAVAVEPDVAVEFIVDSAGTRKKFPPEWFSDIQLLRTSHGPAVHAELPQFAEATLTDQFEGTKTADRVESHPVQDTDKMPDIDLAKKEKTGKEKTGKGETGKAPTWNVSSWLLSTALVQVLSDVILEDKSDEQSDAEYVRGLTADSLLKSLQHAVPQMQEALIQGYKKLQEQVIIHSHFFP